MTLSSSEKSEIVSLWDKVVPNASALGAEALERLFMSFPRTKTYFSHFDLSHGSADLLNHGGKVMNALGEPAKHLDNLSGSLSTLSDLHPFNVRADPENFMMLSQAIQGTLAAHFPEDFTPSGQAAWDKFIDEVHAALTSKYK